MKIGYDVISHCLAQIYEFMLNLLSCRVKFLREKSIATKPQREVIVFAFQLKISLCLIFIVCTK